MKEVEGLEDEGFWESHKKYFDPAHNKPIDIAKKETFTNNSL